MYAVAVTIIVLMGSSDGYADYSPLHLLLWHWNLKYQGTYQCFLDVFNLFNYEFTNKSKLSFYIRVTLDLYYRWRELIANSMVWLQFPPCIFIT